MEKKFQGHFFEIFGVKVETFKEFSKVTKISHSRFFDILWPLCPSTTVPKFVHFHRIINFLRKFAFLLSRFLAHFLFFSAHRSLRLHISKTKQATRTILYIPR